MSDIEDHLRRFRPAGPPPGLLQRIQGAAHAPTHDGFFRAFARSRRMLDWLAPLAAAAAAVVLYTLAAQLRQEVVRDLTPPEDSATVAVVEEVARAFGGDAGAMRIARAAADIEDRKHRPEVLLHEDAFR